MLTCIPEVLKAQELERIDELLARANYQDGKRSAGYRAKRVKNNLQLERDDPNRQEINTIVLEALTRNRLFQRIAIPRSIRPPLISRYEPGMAYGAHVDDALMGGASRVRTDLAVTVFLSDRDQYEGGELMVGTSLGALAVKLPRGDAVVYPASTIHRVNPVSAGERLAAVTWVQSHVRDPLQRELLSDLDLLKQSLDRTNPADETTDLAFKVYSNLLRMWAEA